MEGLDPKHQNHPKPFQHKAAGKSSQEFTPASGLPFAQFRVPEFVRGLGLTLRLTTSRYLRVDRTVQTLTPQTAKP